MAEEDRFDELFRAIGRIEGKLDTTLDLEPRVRHLERRWAWAVGLCSAIAGLITTGVNIVSYHWSAKF